MRVLSDCVGTCPCAGITALGTKQSVIVLGTVCGVFCAGVGSWLLRAAVRCHKPQRLACNLLLHAAY